MQRVFQQVLQQLEDPARFGVDHDSLVIVVDLQLQPQPREARPHILFKSHHQRAELDRLEAVRAEAVAPRNLYKVVFPGDFSIGFLTVLATVIGLVGGFVILLAAANMTWLGVPVAKRMLPTTELVCRVINDRYGVQDCEVPAEYRRGQVPPVRSGK